MSDWKRSAAKRRDARNVKDSDLHKSVSRSKNTKRWCRGKVGVEHVTECARDTRPYTTGYQLVCTVCGKQLAHWWPSLLAAFQSPKPSWVIEQPNQPAGTPPQK